MLTVKQSKVIDYIIKYVEENGFQPSMEEIGIALELSKQSVYYLIKKMKDSGVIISHGKRAIRIKGLSYVGNYRTEKT